MSNEKNVKLEAVTKLNNKPSLKERKEGWLKVATKSLKIRKQSKVAAKPESSVDDLTVLAEAVGVLSR